MPREKRQFENGELYHISLRRIADKILFKDTNDYFRGVFDIYEFNNINHVSITKRRRDRAQFKKRALEIGRGLTPAKFGWGLTPSNLAQIQQVIVEPDKRIKLVEVLSFALMPNHLHLILRQLVDKGISLFMQKFGSGLAAYFFERYYANMKKKGHFFQDRFNAVHIVDDRQLQVAFVYDWANPIALIEPGWKEKGIKNPVKAKRFLEQYKWSSYQDCIDIKNFPSIIEAEKNFIMETMGGADGCRRAVNDWILQKGEIAEIAKNFPKL
ncbi:MAG: transposase [Patescibacteria group bacterium]